MHSAPTHRPSHALTSNVIGLPQDIDGAVPKIRNGTFHFPSGRRTNPLTPDYPPLEKPLVCDARVMCNRT